MSPPPLSLFGPVPTPPLRGLGEDQQAWSELIDQLAANSEFSADALQYPVSGTLQHLVEGSELRQTPRIAIIDDPCAPSSYERAKKDHLNQLGDEYRGSTVFSSAPQRLHAATMTYGRELANFSNVLRDLPLLNGVDLWLTDTYADANALTDKARGQPLIVVYDKQSPLQNRIAGLEARLNAAVDVMRHTHCMKSSSPWDTSHPAVKLTQPPRPTAIHQAGRQDSLQENLQQAYAAGTAALVQLKIPAIPPDKPLPRDVVDMAKAANALGAAVLEVRRDMYVAHLNENAATAHIQDCTKRIEALKNVSALVQMQPQ